MTKLMMNKVKMKNWQTKLRLFTQMIKHDALIYYFSLALIHLFFRSVIFFFYLVISIRHFLLLVLLTLFVLPLNHNGHVTVWINIFSTEKRLSFHLKVLFESTIFIKKTGRLIIYNKCCI
jgi:hypothetical protein